MAFALTEQDRLIKLYLVPFHKVFWALVYFSGPWENIQNYGSTLKLYYFK